MGLGNLLKNYKRVQQLERELAEWKARAERAERFWGERQGEVAELATALQREELKLARAEAECVKKMMPSFIIDAFCGILGITKEELLADSNFQWEEKLKQALRDERGKKKDGETK